MHRNLRSFLELLRREGDLVEVAAEVKTGRSERRLFLRLAHLALALGLDRRGLFDADGDLALGELGGVGDERVGGAAQVGEQEGEAGDLQPLVDVDRIRPVDVASG